MLDRDADALHRQKGHRQRRGQDFAHPRQVGFGDESIDAERQMRPMLLDRGKRQHGDPARRAAPAPAISCQVISIQSRLGRFIRCSLANGAVGAYSRVTGEKEQPMPSAKVSD